MLWILIALLSPLLHGLSNVLDNYLVNKLFKDPVILVFFNSCINLLFLPLVLIIDTPEMISLKLLPFILILGLTNIFYLYPYYKALESDDTSIVTGLFSLGKIVVPFLAYIVVKEKLSIIQYIGFFIIILSATFLAINNKIDNKNNRKMFRVNSSFFWMGLCSLILAVEVVTYKYLFSYTSWATGFSWGVLASVILVLPMLVIKRYREGIISQFSKFKKSFHLFIIEEFLTFGGSGAITLALTLAPVTLVEAVSSFQPIFVLGYAILFSKFKPNVFKEKIDLKNIIKKTILFLIMVIGIVMITK